jgi:hypothetical protein
MTEGEDEPFVVADYEQVRERFGLGSRDHARMRAKRRGWPVEPKNHPGAQTMVRVPRAEWDAAEKAKRSPRTVRDVIGAQERPEPNMLADVLKLVRQEREAAAVREAVLRTERDKAIIEASAQRSRADRADGEAQALREAAAREVRLVEQVDAARRVAETQRDAALAARDAATAELANWRAGGPIVRTIRRWIYR